MSKARGSFCCLLDVGFICWVGTSFYVIISFHSQLPTVNIDLTHNPFLGLVLSHSSVSIRRDLSQIVGGRRKTSF
jgi:hypothetical protein